MHQWKYAWLLIGIIFILAGVGVYSAYQQHDTVHDILTHMHLTSPAFEAGALIPAKFTCDGDSINPKLEISGVPSAARSLALIVQDPDAPVQGGFTHWVLFNIDPKTTVIEENSVPHSAIQGKNGAGQNAYMGPCPPSGAHHYHFMLFALDTSMSSDGRTTSSSLIAAMQGHIIEGVELIGLYEKTK